jgi:2-oxoglutarate dehydrogenase E2 component (dihydrolipoamide succinyltransferase)
MSTPVVMPQMGESIAEGTIVRWIKKIGDAVDRDEPLFEISTDKVDAEIPSPAAGVLVDIKVKEGETVPVNSVVATIGAAGEQAAAPPPPPADAPRAAAAPAAPAKVAAAAQAPEPARAATATEAPKTAAPPPPQSAGNGGSPVRAEAPAASVPTHPATPPTSARPPEGDRQRSSPLVRRIAKDHGVDIAQIPGSGIGGRVTKNDILGFIEKRPTDSARAAAQGRAVDPAPPAPLTRAAGDRIEPMSIMRRKIAEHMVLSKRTSAHVYSVFEVDYTRVDRLRRERRDQYEQHGARLTFTAFIAKVAVDCLRRHPMVNASIDGDSIVYRKDVNLGIAVALDNGLIVPVVKQAGERNILGLSKAIHDVADRARARKLNPDEVHGGTFTITNPGNFGAQFGMPIINQPQVAILGVGTIEKRPVVIDDMIGIRLRGYLTLGYDHRLIDGAVADQFMADVKKGIEAFDESQL